MTKARPADSKRIVTYRLAHYQELSLALPFDDMAKILRISRDELADMLDNPFSDVDVDDDGHAALSKHPDITLEHDSWAFQAIEE